MKTWLQHLPSRVQRQLLCIKYAEPAVTNTAPAPLNENVAPAPAVLCAAPAPGIEYAASERAATYTAPAHVNENVAPAPAVTSDEAEPLGIDAVMAECNHVRRGVLSWELDPDAMHASHRSLQRALSRLAPSGRQTCSQSAAGKADPVGFWRERGGRTRPARARRFGVNRVETPGADPKNVPPLSVETYPRCGHRQRRTTQKKNILIFISQRRPKGRC